MSVINLRKRLERIEAGYHAGAPDRIFSDQPLEDDKAPGLLANWRALIASGEASEKGSVLYIVSPMALTAQEWEAKYALVH